MKIAVIGPQGSGKTTFISDFLARWPFYTTPKTTYREFAVSQNLTINREGSPESQKAILDFLVQQARDIESETDVIVDRTVIDNLVYSTWLYMQPDSEFTDAYMEETASLAKTYLASFDLVFFCSLVDLDEEAKADPVRDADEQYRKEIDSIYRVLMHDNLERSGTFFKAEDDMPPIIEIGGSREQRIALAALYVGADGKPVENTSFVTEEDIREFKAQMGAGK